MGEISWGSRTLSLALYPVSVIAERNSNRDMIKCDIVYPVLMGRGNVLYISERIL